MFRLAGIASAPAGISTEPLRFGSSDEFRRLLAETLHVARVQDAPGATGAGGASAMQRSELVEVRSQQIEAIAETVSASRLGHVPSNEIHTFPFAYRFGLNLTATYRD